MRTRYFSWVERSLTENQVQNVFQIHESELRRVKLVDPWSISLILSLLVSTIYAFGYFFKVAVINSMKYWSIIDFLIQYWTDIM